MSIELKLSRSNRIYRPNEPIAGKIITKFPSSISHQGIRLTATGTVNLQVRGGTAGVIESLYGVVKPVTIVTKSVEVRSSGKLSSGTTEIPFSVILRQQGHDGSEIFYETFHGANISIQYLVTADVMRGYLHKSLSATLEFIIESENANLLQAPVCPEMVSFYITQDTQRHPLLPELVSGFRVIGKIPTQCSLLDPINGELTVESSAIPINSIDIHLLRLESILVGEKIVTETSLVQTTQIADGDVCRGMTLPIYVILPRLLTCPAIFAGPFSVEFQISIVISFQSELSKLHPKADPRTPRLWLAMETLPLRLFRTKTAARIWPCTFYGAVMGRPSVMSALHHNFLLAGK
ncbi:Vacuolar protein sorting-associated protein 26 [Macleaya cordata]|uniref:Vacuolar protein sorting-associated protein 26C n=1 Tax=Macleaya cordata TaxID=56857 RepID=A0A200QXQ8_MACCD|nr:Vacuolar protein sorting-associated protein 26 [Macleaya cordata]